VVKSAIPIDSTAIVQWLASRTDIAIVFGLVSETLGPEVGTPLSVDAVTGSHIGSDVSIRQPLQEIPVPVGRVRRHRFRFAPLPVSEAGQHVLRGHRLLAHGAAVPWPPTITQLWLSTR